MPRVVLHNVRISFPHLAEKNINQDGSEGKYSCAVLIDKNDAANVNAMKAAIEQAKNEGVQKLWRGKAPAGLKNYALQDGDEKADNRPEYAGHYVLNPKTATKPQVLDGSKTLITDPEKIKEVIYPGCYAHVSVSVSAFDSNGAKGVTAYLGNVMFAKDGERFDAHVEASTDFADVQATYDDAWA